MIDVNRSSDNGEGPVTGTPKEMKDTSGVAGHITSLRIPAKFAVQRHSELIHLNLDQSQ
jgi:hypothetical protein